MDGIRYGIIDWCSSYFLICDPYGDVLALCLTTFHGSRPAVTEITTPAGYILPVFLTAFHGSRPAVTGITTPAGYILTVFLTASHGSRPAVTEVTTPAGTILTALWLTTFHGSRPTVTEVTTPAGTILSDTALLCHYYLVKYEEGPGGGAISVTGGTPPDRHHYPQTASPKGSHHSESLFQIRTIQKKRLPAPGREQGA